MCIRDRDRSVAVMAAANKTVWGIHTMDDPLFLNQNLIAIGWEEMGDLSVISCLLYTSNA